MATAAGRIGACVFDAYGTLFDVGSAAAACRDLLGDEAPMISAAWRDKQLDYSWLRAAQGRHTDFAEVTAASLSVTLANFGIRDQIVEQRLLRLYRRLDCYKEVPECLRQLRHTGIKTAILSNGTPAMLDELIDGAGLDGLFDAVLSVEEVGVFKPHPAVYQLAVDHLGFAASQLLFISANGWDAHAASAFGMRVVWCNRAGLLDEQLPGHPEMEMDDLSGLPYWLAQTLS